MRQGLRSPSLCSQYMSDTEHADNVVWCWLACLEGCAKLPLTIFVRPGKYEPPNPLLKNHTSIYHLLWEYRFFFSKKSEASLKPCIFFVRAHLGPKIEGSGLKRGLHFFLRVDLLPADTHILKFNACCFFFVFAADGLGYVGRHVFARGQADVCARL